MSLERPLAKAFLLTPRDTDVPGASSNLQADHLGGKTTLTVSRPLDRSDESGIRLLLPQSQSCGPLVF